MNKNIFSSNKQYFVLLIIFSMNFIWTQYAGMLASSGKSYIFIEGSNQNEDMEFGSINGTVLGGGYIFNNNIEFDLFYMMQEIESDIIPKYNLDGYFAGLYYHDKLWKERNNFPINFRFGIFYEEGEAQARWLTNLGMKISARLSGFGGSIYSNSYSFSIISLIGFLDLHSMKSKSIITYGANYSSEKTNMTSTTIGLIINYENFYISPMMGKIDDIDEVQIVLGMLLPQ